MRFPLHGLLGALLVAVAWPLDWGLDGLRTHLLFFPLWSGYALLVDALAARLRGTSLLTRSPAAFASLFALSVPVWWLFEAANARLHNWQYLGREHFSDLEYALLASVSFSTVLPAVLATAELCAGLGPLRRLARGARLTPTPALARGCALLGALATAFWLWRPDLGFPLVWVAPVLLLEALAIRLRRPALTWHLARGDWRPFLSLWLGGLVCGFFWEMWNQYSYPKWIYHLPHADFAHVFEMPLLGYLGYLPFAQALWLVAVLALPRAPLPFRPAR